MATRPRDWIRVLIDSYHDKRTAYEFGVNPAGRQVRSLLVQRQQQRRQLGRGVGRQGVARRRRLDRGVPHSVLAGALQPERVDARSASPCRAQIGRLNQTDTWPLLARSANGYVSSFGELGGLSMGASPKRLELAPYTVASLDAAAARGQPAAVVVGAGHRDRPGREVRGDAGADADRRPSIPTSVRSRPIPPSSTCRRSRPSSPSAGRSSSKGPATSTSTPTAGTGPARCSTRAASAARRTAPTTCRRATPSTPTTRRSRRSSAPAS